MLTVTKAARGRGRRRGRVMRILSRAMSRDRSRYWHERKQMWRKYGRRGFVRKLQG